MKKLKMARGVTLTFEEGCNKYLENCRQRKLNQLKVASDLNISREALSHYENGKRSPDINMLRKISDYFNVSIDFLINGEEFKPK